MQNDKPENKGVAGPGMKSGDRADCLAFGAVPASGPHFQGHVSWSQLKWHSIMTERETRRRSRTNGIWLPEVCYFSSPRPPSPRQGGTCQAF